MAFWFLSDSASMDCSLWDAPVSVPVRPWALSARSCSKLAGPASSRTFASRSSHRARRRASSLCRASSAVPRAAASRSSRSRSSVTSREAAQPRSSRWSATRSSAAGRELTLLFSSESPCAPASAPASQPTRRWQQPSRRWSHTSKRWPWSSSRSQQASSIERSSWSSSRCWATRSRRSESAILLSFSSAASLLNSTIPPSVSKPTVSQTTKGLISPFSPSGNLISSTLNLTFGGKRISCSDL
mmetsp:Transcript_9494/g.22559  ORF Transcript_9494/g.22559 Transcript_9494/m.22559 type:complete len:243 (-) Transcript_9494:978-1706(-)